MFRIYTKTDGLQVAININDLISVEDVGTHRIISTVIGDYDIIEPLNEIFPQYPNLNKFSHN